MISMFAMKNKYCSCLILSVSLVLANGFINPSTQPEGEKKSCPDGSVLPVTNEKSDQCVQCDSGTFANSTARECQQCSPGMFQDSKGSVSCKNCPAGRYTTEPGQTTCTECPEGTFAGSDSPTLECTPCSAGSYQDTVGSGQCKNCPPGTFTAQKGQSKCELCKAGSYQDNSTSVHCSQCKAGTYQDHAGSVGCRMCNRGTYSDKDGLFKCLDCPQGTSQLERGSKSCPKCPKGTHQTRFGSISCDKCPYNQYQDEEGKEECKVCPDKKVTDDSGNCDPSLCYWRDCPKGYILVSEGNCKICPVGTYQPYSDGKACLKCPRGTYANSRGTEKCRKCPSTAFTQNTGAASFYDCVGPALALFEEENLQGPYTVLFSKDTPIDSGPYFRSLKILAGPWSVDSVVYQPGYEALRVNLTLAMIEPILNNYFCYLPGNRFSGLINRTMDGELCARWNPPGTAKWRSDGKCGSGNILAHTNGEIAQCDPTGKNPCCSSSGFCGNTAAHCFCDGCVDYKAQSGPDNYCKAGQGGAPFCLDSERKAVSCGVPKCGWETICKTGFGDHYRGSLTSTTYGYTCQNWESNLPHPHSYDDDEGLEKYGIGNHNFCRNPSPDDQGTLWCYTTSIWKRWDTCDLQPCMKYDERFLY